VEAPSHISFRFRYVAPLKFISILASFIRVLYLVTGIILTCPAAASMSHLQFALSGYCPPPPGDVIDPEGSVNFAGSPPPHGSAPPPPPPDGVDDCDGGTGKQRQKTIIRQTATLATSYIEMFINVRIPDLKTKPTCGPAAAATAAAKRPVKRKATSVDRVVRLKNDQHG